MLDLSHLAAISECEAQAVKCLEAPPTPRSLFSSDPRDLPWHPHLVLVMGTVETWSTHCTDGVAEKCRAC